MTNRQEKRKAQRQATNIIATAKKDMVKWVETLDYLPTESEMRSWQAGYIYGINRMAQFKEED
jgi:hypothetical protein